MRVAFLTHEPYDPPSGGGSSEAPYLIREFVSRGHQVHLFCPQFSNMDTVRSRDGMRLHPFDSWSMGRYTRWRSLKYAAYPFALEQKLRSWLRQHPDSGVFAQHSISGVTAHRVASLAQGPVVLNYLDQLTGFIEGWEPGAFWRPVARTLQRWECGLAKGARVDGVLAVSDELMRRLEPVVGPNVATMTLRFGMDSARFPYRPSTESSRPVVVMHGSMDRHHLGPILAGAMRIVAKRRPGTVFRFIGRRTPSLARVLDQASGSGMAVEHTPFCPYDRIGEEIRQATIGMIPYEDTAGGRCAFVAKAVEYAAVGLPWVSTRLAGIADYFQGERSVRLTDFDPEGFAEAILGLIPEAVRGDLVDDAATLSRRVHGDLAWESIARRAVDFFEAIGRRNHQKM